MLLRNLELMSAMNPQNRKTERHTYYNKKNGVLIILMIALVM